MKKVDLLAPAGNREAFIGAINAGCDAVYLAGKQFGARSSATNFERDDIAFLLRFAHLRGVKVYITVNTLIFDDEVEALLEWTDYLVEQKVDALIVQDLGMMALLAKRYPEVAIHASTQANTHSIDQARFFQSLGIKRIVLARETDVATAISIKRETNLEVEVFIHGALCVSYSGNCLHSSMIGGRSGNRGECAQPCRLPYRLVRESTDLNEPTHLMSTKDLMTIDRIGELIEAGIDCFKIEGRMRKAEYVVETVRQYREAMDAYMTGRTFDSVPAIDHLKRVFNRSYTSGYLFDIPPYAINHAERPNHIGVEAGTVMQFNRGKIVVELVDDLAVGDGVRFLSAEEHGMVVSRILYQNEAVKTAKKGDFVTLDVAVPIAVGTTMAKTLDIILETDAARYFDPAFKSIPLFGSLRVTLDQPLVLEIDSLGVKVEVTSSFNAQKAQKQPTSDVQIRNQIAKLGGTPYYWAELHLSVAADIFVPVNVLNDLRRDAIALWESLRLKQTAAVIDKTLRLKGNFNAAKQGWMTKVETLEQWEAATRFEPMAIAYNASLPLPSDRDESIDFFAVQRRIIPANHTVSEILPAMLEEVGSIANQKNIPWIAGSYLNVTNIHTAALLADHGAISVTLSPELHQSRVEAFARNYEATYHFQPNMEMVVYGRVDLMISKYCPIAKSTGVKKTHCNLCHNHQYYLKDRMDFLFPLLDDGDCNIRLLHAKPTLLFDYVQSLRQSGIHRFRLDFTTESAAEVEEVIKLWNAALQQALPRIERNRYTTGRFLK
jgi:U32 family peptidase